MTAILEIGECGERSGSGSAYIYKIYKSSEWVQKTKIYERGGIERLFWNIWMLEIIN
jgi:hypothetical protein